MRRRSKQEQVPLLVLGQSLQQLEALLATLMRADTGMRLVDHDELWAGPRKRVATPFRLDVVEADDGVGVRIEQRLRRRQPAFEPGRTAFTSGGIAAAVGRMITRGDLARY